MWGRASSAEQGRRLGERRRNRRRIGLVIFIILIIAATVAVMYGLQQKSVRISQVNIFGYDISLAASAMNAMNGSYFGIIPRDSIFFYPADRIRADILSSHLDFAAVSLFRNGLTGLSIKIDERAPVARWCSSQTASSTDNCYIFDASGFIFASSTSLQLVNNFILYESLSEGGQTSLTSPIGTTLPNADKLPATFDFARQLSTLGSPVEKIVIHDGEVDDYLASGTRITYLLGNEQNAYTALVSASESLNLSQGNIEYVDLRFDGKVYLKKK